jgi:hypothetical protein
MTLLSSRRQSEVPSQFRAESVAAASTDGKLRASANLVPNGSMLKA